jgi:hypothetical protein
LNSTSWRATRPFRRIMQLISGAEEIDAFCLQRATAEQAETLVFNLYHSLSWRLAAPLRLVKRLAKRLRYLQVVRP